VDWNQHVSGDQFGRRVRSESIRRTELNTKISRRTFVSYAAAAPLALAAASAAHAIPLEEEAKPLRFAVYGDCRDGHDIHRKIVSLIIKDEPTMVFQTGDLVHRGADESLWKIFDGITGDMRKKVAFYPARGNHEFGEIGKIDAMTGPFTNGNKAWYSLDKSNCHFIVLVLDEHTPFDSDSEQYKWLVKNLEEFKGKSKHTFVFFHVPPYSIGSHGMNPEIQDSLCPVFTKYGVRIVFTGHDHNYYHTTRNGIPYVVTGGGGAPLYDCFPEKGAIAGDKYEKVNHYCLVDVKGNDVTVQAIRADGTLIEKFTVSAK
jgi:3',5'-cyclic AMP phosphodiesterase CpdA